MKIDRIDVHAFRAPTPRPVATSFGVMRDRPAVFVRLTAADGAFGWGEIFANWPAAGAEHRARLLVEDIAPLVLGRPAGDPAALFAHLTRATHIRALQSGEWGPFAQVIAGLDTAAHDMAARRAGLPLARHLNPDAAGSVRVYLSGIAIADGPAGVARARARGITAVKVKVGFDAARDVAALEHLATARRPAERLMADANQAWDVDAALAFLDASRVLDLAWLEEPIPADARPGHWQALARAAPMPLAGGENIAGADAFGAAIEAGHLSVIQPDVAKWGGVTGCLSVAQAALAAGRSYCPHFLGGGIGLLASAHLLAAAGGAGLLELDDNENPLRDAFFGCGDPAPDGRFTLSAAPGLGIDDLPDAIAPYRTLTLTTP